MNWILAGCIGTDEDITNPGTGLVDHRLLRVLKGHACFYQGLAEAQGSRLEEGYCVQVY